jgi:hypothetical protein
MCCGDEAYDEPQEKAGSCPHCGAGIDADGWALERCVYSPVACDACFYQPCDGSC